MSLIPSSAEKRSLSTITPQELPYLSEDTVPSRGKILAVVTSQEVMGSSGKKTGSELTELSRSYYVFQANGFEVDIASPKGGNAPVIIDWDDVGAFDFAFLNDSVAQRKVKNTIALQEVTRENYEAVYFLGGKGAMYDFPKNADIQDIVKTYAQKGKAIGAVCHGPAALVNVTLENGNPYLSNKAVCGFTNAEELFLIPEAKSIFPFLLQDKLIDQGARFNEGNRYLENVVQDGSLITGQNPWSTWLFAETMVQQLGYLPKKRASTAEENTIDILSAYVNHGYSKAKEKISGTSDQKQPIDRTLLAMHCIVSAMEYDLGGFFNKLRLLVYAKKLSA
ncbi:MAG: type 1 glutamine amidotransferase domain-containing protein [Bacteroidota bacterium]